MTQLATPGELSRYLPRQIPTPEQAIARVREEESLRPGFLSAVGAAIGTEWAGAWAWRQFQQLNYGPDPDFPGVFSLDDDTRNQLLDGLDEQFYGMMSNALSLPHAIELRRQALGIQESQKKLAGLGWGGVALSVGASILDPAFVATGIASGGILPTMTAAGRFARFVRGGFVAATADAPINVYMATQRPDFGADDVILATLAAGAFGGSLNAVLGRGPVAQAVERTANETELSSVIHGAMGAAGKNEFGPEVRAMIHRDTLTESGRLKWKRELDVEVQRHRVSELIENSGLDPVKDADEIAQLRAMDPDDVLRRFAPVDVMDNPHATVGGGEEAARAAAAETRNPNLRPPTEDEIAARAAQIREDFPNMSPESARETAIFQIGQEDAIRQGIPPPPRKPGTDGGEAVPPDGKKPPPPKRGLTDFFNIPKWRPSKAAMRWLRFGIVGRIHPDAPGMNLAMIRMARDSLLRYAPDGTPVPAIESGTEWGLRSLRRTMTNFYHEWEPALAAWSRENGYTGLKASEGRELFGNAVGFAVRSDEAFHQASTHVKRAARAVRKGLQENLELMQRHGVRASENVLPNQNYLTRVWVPQMVRATQRKIGSEQGLFEFVQRAIQSATPELSDKQALAYARGLIRTVRDMDLTDIEKARLFSRDSADAIGEAIRRGSPGISDAEVNDIVRMLTKKGDAGAPDMLRRRLLLDEDYHEWIDTPNGEVKVSISDMLDNNAERVFAAYTRSAIGHSAEATVMQDMSAYFGREKDPFTSFEAVKDAVRQEAMDRGINIRRVEADVRRLDTAYRKMVGRRQSGDINHDGVVAQALRILRSFNYIRIGGGFQVAQIPEIGNTVGQAGTRTMLKQMPALRDYLKRGADGRYTNEMLAQVEAITGIGNDHFLHQITDRLDDALAPSVRLTATGGEDGARLDSVMRGAERVMHSGARLQTKYTGLRFIDSFERVSSVVAAVQHVADLAAKGRVSVKRLYELGMDESMSRRVFAHLNDPEKIVTTEGSFGRVVKRINFEKWGDEDATNAFVTAIDKLANNWVQTNNIGSMARWMDYDLAKVFLQFRAFNINAWESQTLHKVQMRDMQAFMSITYSTFLAALAYTGYTYAQSIGRKDAEQFRKERLDPELVMRVAWARSGASSLLPAAIDNLWGMTGRDPMFQIARHSGLSSGGFTQFPASDIVEKGYRAAGSLVRQADSAITGRPNRFTQADANAWASLMPFSRVIGYKNVLDAIVTRMPKTNQE